jgi:hypothetical protein
VYFEVKLYHDCHLQFLYEKGVIHTDCDADLSNVKRMDIWTAIRTILEQNPGIKSGQLWRKVREKTGLSRSTLYVHFDSLAERKKICRDKGRYFLPEQFEVYIRTKKYPKKRFLSKADLEIALNHSRKLILGLEAIFVDDQFWYPQAEPWATMVRTEGISLKRFAMEHLKSGYPVIFKKMMTYFEIREKLEWLIEKKHYSKEFVDNVRISLRTAIAPSEYMTEEIKNFIFGRSKKIPEDLAEIMEKNIRTFFELHEEIKNIEAKIENGEPLSGTCKRCPNVRVDK